MAEGRIHKRYFDELNKKIPEFKIIDWNAFQYAIDNNEAKPKEHWNIAKKMNTQSSKYKAHNRFNYFFINYVKTKENLQLTENETEAVSINPFYRNDYKALKYHWLTHLLVDITHNKSLNYVPQINLGRTNNEEIKYCENFLNNLGIKSKYIITIIKSTTLPLYTHTKIPLEIKQRVKFAKIKISSSFKITQKNINIPYDLKEELIKTQKNKTEKVIL